MRLLILPFVVLSISIAEPAAASPLTERAQSSQRLVDAMRTRLLKRISNQASADHVRLKGLLRVAEGAVVQAHQAAALGNADAVDAAMAKITLAAWNSEGRRGEGRAELSYWVSPKVRSDDSTAPARGLTLPHRAGL